MLKYATCDFSVLIDIMILFITSTRFFLFFLVIDRSTRWILINGLQCAITLVVAILRLSQVGA